MKSETKMMLWPRSIHRHLRASACICGFALLSGCGLTIPGHVKFPDGPPQYAAAQPAPAPVRAPTGGIYSEATYRPLFEDIRARHVGDVLTVALVEKTSASRKASSTADRTGSSNIAIGPSLRLPVKGLNGMTFDGSSGSKFDGKGETASDVLLTGTLTVTVVAVLPNGNLAVAGEKQIGVNSNMERLKLTGVVHPSTILAGNTVQSSAVADARIELSGRGILDETQTMGWLQRFFLSVLPL